MEGNKGEREKEEKRQKEKRNYLVTPTCHK